MPATKRARDPRLDFFRGLAMLIIFIAHVPDNAWSQFIPARFGFSSAAEMFVFCSGFASALAFGSVFVRRGWWVGTARILYRIWQLYWTHIGLFLFLAAISIAATRLHVGTRDYAADLSFGLFASDGPAAILGLLTLSYVPDLLNILPMYIVLLAGIPAAMALSKVHPLLVFTVSIVLWSVVLITGANLSAGGMPSRGWFFDPFAWQLMFLTGFGFGMGWLPRPSFNHPVLLPLGIAVLILSVPINFWAFTDNFAALRSIRDSLVPDGLVATTQLHFLRYAHFLVLLYVALSIVDLFPRMLTSSVAAPVLMIGQQSLSAFVSSIAIAWIAGIVLDVAGHNFLSLAAANVFGFAAIFAVAKGVAWFKSTPWTITPGQHFDARIGQLRPPA
jgi:hypothetical protein